MSRKCVFLAALLLLTSPSPASATSVAFLATDLADSVPGEDLWRYTYVVSGFDFDTNLGFSIHFDPFLFDQLEDPPPPVGNWDIITLQPDPLLPADGLYDALALVDDPTLALPFTLTFIWLGAPATAPGAQLFEINEFDSSGTFVGIVESGATVPVPEPSTLSLVGIGLLYLLRRRR